MADKNTLANIDAALKEAYPIGSFIKLYSEEKEFWKSIESTSDFYQTGGRRSVVPLLSGRIMTPGFRAENTALPNARSVQPQNAYVSHKNIYVRGYITGQVIDDAEKSIESFAPILTMTADQMRESMLKQMNFQAYRASTGVITTLGAGAAGVTSLTVASAKGLHVDMEIDIHNGTTYQAQGVIITGISGTTVTVDTAVTADNGASIYTAGSKDNAFNGLADNLASTGTVHGIDKATATWYQGNAVNASVGTLTDAAMTALITASNKIQVKPQMWLTTHEVWSKIWTNLLRPDRRYADTDIAGGFKTFTYHGIKVVPDDDCPAGYLYLVDPSFLKIMWSGEPSWIDKNGNYLHYVEGYDAYEMAMKCYLNMIATWPKAIPFSYGITEA